MALLLWLALLSRVRAGDEEWPKGMRPQRNAPASFKALFPALFLPLADSLRSATDGFDDAEREKGELQWAFSPKKDMAATSSVLAEISAGKSHAYIVSRYKSNLEKKISQKEAAAAEKEKNRQEKAAAKPTPKAAAKPPANKRKVAAAATPVEPRVSLARQHSAIASGETTVTGKRIRIQKVFYD